MIFETMIFNYDMRLKFGSKTGHRQHVPLKFRLPIFVVEKAWRHVPISWCSLALHMKKQALGQRNQSSTEIGLIWQKGETCQRVGGPSLCRSLGCQSRLQKDDPWEYIEADMSQYETLCEALPMQNSQNVPCEKRMESNYHLFVTKSSQFRQPLVSV